jgi:hypothetical protein
MSDLEQATRAVLRAIRNKNAPPGDGGPYIWTFRDKGGPFDAGVFNPERFACNDPDGYANWIMGERGERCLNPPHPSDREAIRLLPERLQRKIRNHEKTRTKNDESAESGNREDGSRI